MTATEEAFLLLASADDYLRYAEGTRRSGFYPVVMSLAYYAAFYAAQAVVAYHREGPKTHKGVQTRFRVLAVVKSDFPAEVAGLLDKLKDDRLKADYDVTTKQDWRDGDASAAIDRARTFVEEVHGWFRRHHTPEDTE